MQFAKIKDDTILEFPSYPQRDFPQTSFGDDWQGGIVEGATYVVVEIENTPILDYLTQDAVSQPPTLIDGKWIQKIIAVESSLEEKEKRKADKEQRDADQIEGFLSRDEIKALKKLLKP